LFVMKTSYDNNKCENYSGMLLWMVDSSLMLNYMHKYIPINKMSKEI
jgi:hypothetical protein